MQMQPAINLKNKRSKTAQKIFGYKKDALDGKGIV